MSENYIPVIDFETCSLAKEECSHDDLAKIGKQLVEGFSNVGFVYLKNYGFTDAYIEDLHKVTGRFFTSPIKEKMRYERKGMSASGYIVLGKENASGDPKNLYDYKEAFNIDGAGYSRVGCEFPDDIAPGFSNGLLDFMDRGQKLSLRILHALAIEMALKDENFFYKCHSKMHTKENYTSAKTLYYPAIVNELKPGQLRAGPHADYTTFSLVFQDQIGGLQVKRLDGSFVDATPIKDTVVVNVGDVLQRWTNGKLKSTVHRVVGNPDERKGKFTRRSLAYFPLPDNDVFSNKPLVYKDENLNVEDEPTNLMSIEESIRERMKGFWDVTENGKDEQH